MSTNTSVSDANTSGSAESVESQINTKDQVAYETYRRAVGEAKAAKEASRKLEEQLNAIRHKEMEDRGEFSKAKAEYEAQVKKLSEEKQNLQKGIRHYIVTDKVKTHAAQLGARPDALNDLLKIESWDDVEISEEGGEFRPDENIIKEKLARLAKEKSYFFSKQAGPLKDVIVGGAGSSNTAKNPYSNDTSMDDLKSMFKQQVSKK